jgi:7-cyano-7-deazaguanine synthase
MMANKFQISKDGAGKKALVVLSGGQDSTTCLFLALEMGFEVHALTFNYGQRHQRELDSACRIAALAGCASHETLSLGAGVLQGTSPLVVAGAELEQYKDHQSLPGGIEKTFVPMRNQLFFTIAANRAVCIGAPIIFTGVCEEDYGGYPDCRQVFIRSLETTINLSNEDASPPIKLYAPLMNLSKAMSVQLAVELPRCYAALAYSHTSYDGQYPPTGHDHATLLRAKGFEEALVPDPLVLRAEGEGLMALPETDNYAEHLVVHFRDLLHSHAM